jgi:hypothetical protein
MNNNTPTVAAICLAYLVASDGAQRLHRSTARLEATRLTFLVLWNASLPGDQLDNEKMNQFIKWRHQLGNLGRGREGQPIPPACLDVMVISIRHAMAWAVRRGILKQLGKPDLI